MPRPQRASIIDIRATTKSHSKSRMGSRNEATGWCWCWWWWACAGVGSKAVVTGTACSMWWALHVGSKLTVKQILIPKKSGSSPLLWSPSLWRDWLTLNNGPYMRTLHCYLSGYLWESECPYIRYNISCCKIKSLHFYFHCTVEVGDTRQKWFNTILTINT